MINPADQTLRRIMVKNLLKFASEDSWQVVHVEERQRDTYVEFELQRPIYATDGTSQYSRDVVTVRIETSNND